MTWVPAPFDSIIDGVNSGKYDLGVSSFSVTPDRLKQVDMVTYFTAGTEWAAAKGNPKHVNLANACGLPIAVQEATTQADDIAARSKACTHAGRPAIKISTYSGQDQATVSVVSGKNVAMLADSPIAAYAIKSTHGKLQQIGSIYDSAPYGYVVPKKNAALAQAIAGALKKLRASGAYKRTLDKWGSASGGISTLRRQVSPPGGSPAERLETSARPGHRARPLDATDPGPRGPVGRPVRRAARRWPTGRRAAAARARRDAPTGCRQTALASGRRGLVGRAGQPGRGRGLVAGRGRAW